MIIIIPLVLARLLIVQAQQYYPLEKVADFIVVVCKRENIAFVGH